LPGKQHVGGDLAGLEDPNLAILTVEALMKSFTARQFSRRAKSPPTSLRLAAASF